MLLVSMGVAAAGTRQAGSFPIPKATLMRWGLEGLGALADSCCGVLAMATGWDPLMSWCWPMPHTPCFLQASGSSPGDFGAP